MRKLSPKIIKLMLNAILKNEDVLYALSDGEVTVLKGLNLTQIQLFGFSADEAIKISYSIFEEASKRLIF